MWVLILILVCVFVYFIVFFSRLISICLKSGLLMWIKVSGFGRERLMGDDKFGFSICSVLLIIFFSVNYFFFKLKLLDWICVIFSRLFISWVVFSMCWWILLVWWVWGDFLFVRLSVKIFVWLNSIVSGVCKLCESVVSRVLWICLCLFVICVCFLLVVSVSCLRVLVINSVNVFSRCCCFGIINWCRFFGFIIISL